MRGGKSVGSGRLDLKQACIILLVLQLAWQGAFTASNANAHPGHDAEDCAPTAAREQSIVISAKKLTDSQESPVTEADESDQAEGLQPIAKVSEYEPELADPMTVARVPTLADPPKSEAPESVKKGKQLQKLEKQPKEPSIIAKTEVASFNGITPGISKRINVLRSWGDPRSDDTQAAVLKYRFDDLPAVKVLFNDNLVEAIVVELDQPKLASKLARKLSLQQIRPVTMQDVEGVEIALAYPERGVVLRYAKQDLGLAFASDEQSSAESGARVGSILIQPIQAELFVQRAEAHLETHFTNAIADLETALQYDRTLGDARLKLSEMHFQIGKAVTAERYAAEAVDVDPQNPSYRLQWAKSLRLLARYDRAVEEVRAVLETPNIAPIVRAEALNEMGLLASLGSKKVARKAMPLHSKAIEIADQLAVSDDPNVSRRAKRLLVEAHLAVAVEISTGAWQEKDETVPQWIERASGLAEALINEDESYLPLRLQVAVSALAAAANLEKPINPLLWIEESEETVAEIKTQVFDPLAASQYDWQLGLAYFHGSQIEHRRSEPDSAIHLGELADQQLSDLARERDEMPDTGYLLGRLYFQIGAVHAVHYEDHVTACQWYDEAVDRLLNPVPVTTMAGPQQHGDALVSMGVSYWSQDDRRQAIEVTEAGVELIQEAVSSGLLEQETLMVSYNNLSAMYQAQGDKEPAARYERLAKQVTGSKLTKKPARTNSQRR